MTRRTSIPSVRASEAARQAIARLSRDAGPLSIVRSARRDGQDPAVRTIGTTSTQPGDVVLSSVDGIPVYVPAQQLDAWERGELDVEVGYGNTGSLPASDGLHFTAHVVAHPVPRLRRHPMDRGSTPEQS